MIATRRLRYLVIQKWSDADDAASFPTPLKSPAFRFPSSQTDRGSGSTRDKLAESSHADQSDVRRFSFFLPLRLSLPGSEGGVNTLTKRTSKILNCPTRTDHSRQPEHESLAFRLDSGRIEATVRLPDAHENRPLGAYSRAINHYLTTTYERRAPERRLGSVPRGPLPNVRIHWRICHSPPATGTSDSAAKGGFLSHCPGEAGRIMEPAEIFPASSTGL